MAVEWDFLLPIVRRASRRIVLNTIWSLAWRGGGTGLLFAAAIRFVAWVADTVFKPGWGAWLDKIRDCHGPLVLLSFWSLGILLWSATSQFHAEQGRSKAEELAEGVQLKRRVQALAQFSIQTNELDQIHLDPIGSDGLPDKTWVARVRLIPYLMLHHLDFNAPGSTLDEFHAHLRGTKYGKSMFEILYGESIEKAFSQLVGMRVLRVMPPSYWKTSKPVYCWTSRGRRRMDNFLRQYQVVDGKYQTRPTHSNSPPIKVFAPEIRPAGVPPRGPDAGKKT